MRLVIHLSGVFNVVIIGVFHNTQGSSQRPGVSLVPEREDHYSLRSSSLLSSFDTPCSDIYEKYVKACSSKSSFSNPRKMKQERLGLYFI
ncbi:Uncharacterized protein TCM_002411 [Theobroma cacao]|uniref:Uncharacterized protein n=1 Tax=Theobroma cacao TaxID=3641 RepID=A0A061DL34_THECC|nr:Uncharacterized protein TCM_002411 [Theobroma cacao]